MRRLPRRTGRSSAWPAVVWALAVAQLLLAGRVLARLLRTARGERIPVASAAPAEERVTVVVPVLDERRRLAPCLDGLLAQGPEVAEILVVDGGSRDGTQDLVRAYAGRDPRLRLVDAVPVPADWNGKAHNLQVGLDHASDAPRWVLTVDADVRPAPTLVRSLLAFARERDLPALSVATAQEVSGSALAALHPALLTTLVYRFGIPGHATDHVAAVQANGQCFLLRRDVLLAAGGFGPTRDSLCEDVTLARRLASLGHRVGFYESDDLVSVAMYDSWRDAWRNWTRSLPLRDRYAGLAGWLGLAEVALVQALPLPLVLVLASRRPRAGPVAALARVSALLVAVRLGVLVGTARAYKRPPWGYWLSPACDAPAALAVWLNAVRRRHEWRGRPIVRGGPR